MQAGRQALSLTVNQALSQADRQAGKQALSLTVNQALSQAGK